MVSRWQSLLQNLSYLPRKTRHPRRFLQSSIIYTNRETFSGIVCRNVLTRCWAPPCGIANVMRIWVTVSSKT